METKSVEELCSYLQDEICVDDEVLSNLKKHKIDGETFLQLNEEYLREVAPLLGDRIKLKRVITSALEPSLCETPCTSTATTPRQVSSISGESPGLSPYSYCVSV